MFWSLRAGASSKEMANTQEKTRRGGKKLAGNQRNKRKAPMVDWLVIASQLL